MVFGITEGAQDISFQQMAEIQQKLNDIVAADPDTAAYGANCRRRRRAGRRGNNGRIYIALKPWEERVGGSAQQFIARMRPKFAAVSGGMAFLQAAQDIRVGGRLTKTEFQYTLQDANLDELFEWSPKVLAKLRELPMLRDVTTDQQTGGTTVTLTIDRDKAARFGVQPQVIDDTLYDAFGQRQITQYFTPGELLPPDPGGDAGPGGGYRHAEQAVCAIQHRAGGADLVLCRSGRRRRCSRCRSATRASFRR